MPKVEILDQHTLSVDTAIYAKLVRKFYFFYFFCKRYWKFTHNCFGTFYLKKICWYSHDSLLIFIFKIIWKYSSLIQFHNITLVFYIARKNLTPKICILNAFSNFSNLFPCLLLLSIIWNKFLFTGNCNVFKKHTYSQSAKIYNPKLV